MRYDPEHTYKDGECRWSEQEIALRTRRALPEDAVPSAVPRVEEPPVPLRQRGSPGAPEDEGGQEEMAPPVPPLEDLPHDLPSLVEAEGEDGLAAEESADDETAAPARRRRRQMAEQGT